MTKSSAARECERCGRPLSRYNAEPVCASCAHEPDVSTTADRAVGEWLSRAGVSTALQEHGAGSALRAYRLAAGLSQASLAAMLGMTQQNLSQIEGGRAASMEQRQRMVAVLGLVPEDLGLASQPSAELDVSGSRDVAESRARWRAERRWLNQHRNELARRAAQLYPDEWQVPDTPLLAHPRWTVAEPIELRSIGLELDESPHAVVVDGSEPAAAAVRPLRASTVRFDRYTAAIKHLDPPRLFESRPSYRLLSADLVDRRLGFGMAAYFDKLDVSEALGHETAIAAMRHREGMPSADQLRGQLPFRELIDDPFSTERRAIIPAITTLTIRLRRHPSPPAFLLHWRDPARVATAGGTYDVIPAGEFQPSSVALWDRRSDFDLWRNIVREYAEELLGAPEHDGTRSAPIVYNAWPFYRDLDRAFSDGTLSAHVLGLGLDALTLAATILTVVVIDDDVFEQTFGDVVHYNDEGEIVALGGNRAAEGVPFTRESVERLLTSEPMASPGAACLALAWRHRSHLLGVYDDGVVTSAQPRMREPLTDSEREWLEIRAYLGKNRFELGRSAAVLYPHHLRVGPTPLLTDRRWVPSGPVPLGDLALRLEKSRSVPDLSGAAAATIALPERPDGSRYESYSEAIGDLTGRTFDNRGTYRLQGGDLSERSQLAFGLGMYFDGLDTGEAAAHEFAAVQLGRLSPDQQRIRFAIGDPCDPSRRPTNFAISTLTLRYERAAGAATFLLHRRDPQKVGHAGGLYQVLPTGVFQAAGEAAWNLRNDFDLWRSMIREYAEELLGGSEDYGAERSPIDYDAWPFAAAMTHGLVEGSIRAHVLGLGLDPLTFATDLLTVVVIDSALYDDLFGGLISTFDEGHVVSGLDDEPSTDGVPFAADTVARFVEREPTQAAGAAVLWSAWQHRAVLLE